MLLILVLFSLAQALSIPPAVAPKSPAQSQKMNSLAVFIRLLGRDWEAEFAGNKGTGTQHFEWALGEKFVRNTRRVGSPQSQTATRARRCMWDACSERIVWWYWNTTGGYLTGIVTVTSDGSLLAKGEKHGPRGQFDWTRELIQFGDD